MRTHRTRHRGGRRAAVVAAVLVAVAGCAATVSAGGSATRSNPAATAQAATASSAKSRPTPIAGRPVRAQTSSTSPAPPTTSPLPSATSTLSELVSPPTPEPPPPPPPPPPVDALTGGQPVAGPVIAAKIDNTAAAFPQYGVARADVVYVEQVEGGLTRLLAVFHSELPTEVGPIRSVRTTDAELLPTFGNPVLAFSGGAGGPLDALARSGVVNGSGFGGYWRSGAAAAPYNVHVDLQALARAAPAAGVPADIGFAFALADARVETAGNGIDVTVRFQDASTAFAFDGAAYQLLRGGGPARDADGTPVRADNVVVQRVDAQPDGTVDSAGSPSLLSRTVGAGEFTLFRDGRALPGTWSRGAPNEPTRFLDPAGAAVPFKPGRTWVVLATQTASVSAS